MGAVGSQDVEVSGGVFPYGEFLVVFLHRVGADAWVGAAIETFNEVLEVPIDQRVVHERWEQNQKDFSRLKKLARLQRAWQETVRGRPFEYLITDSFAGEVL